MAHETVFYAIGDVHGEAARLRDLHAQIYDFHEACYPNDIKHIVHVGDYVDRGPNSRGVIETLMAMEATSPETVTNLMGNHEEMMLNAYRDVDVGFWLRNGGDSAMASYGLSDPAQLPVAHMDWIASLPTTFVPEGRDLIFVHAGVDPRTYPDDDIVKRRWMRGSRFFDTAKWVSPALEGMRVVHGHTPTHDAQPDVTPDGRRINLDTGAAFGGALTAGVFKGAERPVFLQT
ncbi:MAG: metallophosphoesterase family protein [Pseudomonadota bacterium]